MDVLTPRGQVTLEQERRAARLFEAHTPGVRYVATRKDAPARVDAVIEKDGVIVAVAEQKSRSMTRSQLAQWDDEWLVTFDKLVAARSVALEFGVPLYGLLYLVPDDSLLVVRITDNAGGFVTPMRIERTRTQATVNGGSAVRANAFIKVTDARVLR